MNNKFVAALLVIAALAVVLAGRDSPSVRRWLAPLGVTSADVARMQDVVRPAHDAGPPGSLAAAGVHKCATAGGIVYSDRTCPHGSRELAADGGTISVMAFPKAAPPPSEFSSSAGSNGLVKGFSREELDRVRDREIEDAANR